MAAAYCKPSDGVEVVKGARKSTPSFYQKADFMRRGETTERAGVGFGAYVLEIGRRRYCDESSLFFQRTPTASILIP